MATKSYFVLILLALLVRHVHSQNEQDSLENLLNKTNDGLERITLLNELSGLLINSNPELSLQKAQEAFHLAQTINHAHGVAISYLRMGNYYDIKNNYDTALYLYNKAISLAQKNDDRLAIAQGKIRIGITKRYQGHFDEAIAHLESGLELSIHLKNDYWIAYAHNVIGLVYQQKGEFDTSLEHALKALDIRQKLNSKIDIASSLGNVGLVYDYKGEFVKALDYYFKSLELNEKIGALSGAAINWNNIGIVYGMQGNSEKSLDAYQKALELHTQTGNKRYMAGTLDNIGQNYYDKGWFIKALEVYQQTLEIRKEIGDTFGMATSLMNIGDMQRLQGRFKEALPQYEQAFAIWAESGDKYGQADALHNLGKLHLQLNNADSAMMYYEQALELRRSTGVKSGLATCLNSIASLQRKSKNFNEALANYQEALSLAEEIGNGPVIVTSLKGLAFVYYDLENYVEALHYAERANEKLKQVDQIIYQKDTHYILARIYSKLKNHELAYAHQIKFTELSDSLLNSETSSQLAQLQVQFESEQKERQIADQKHQITLLDATNSYRQKLLWMGGSGLVLLFGLILVIRSRRFAMKEKDIHQHYSQMLLTSHEEERKRISRDLHDSVGQSLMLIKNKILLDSGGDTADMVSQALEEVRSISKALHPALLEEIGLTASIEKLILEFDESTDIFFTAEVDKIDGIFTKEHELHIFRIVQESINNLIKHANTPSANIQVSNQENKVTIHIRDFGVGFDLTSTSFTNSLGMKTLKERTQILNGKIVIHSENNKGTSILLELPK